jgi:hypothetical protein
VANVFAIISFHDKENLHHFTFNLKSENPVMDIMCSLPMGTLAEDVPIWVLLDLGFEVIHAKQMTMTEKTILSIFHCFQ